ncbi:hypothetical protein DBB25_06180 [Yersinia pestis]|nr:hypothetical protein DBB25_06180 [Yersinia pestis]
MTLLKIATSARLASYVETQRGVVYLNQTDFTDVAAVNAAASRPTGIPKVIAVAARQQVSESR